MEAFWRLLEKSTITSFLITIGVVGAAVYCWVSGNEMPEGLQMATTLILGYFFGAKAQIALNNHKVRGTESTP